MRFLGLDLGRATIGLALADEVLRTARPLRTVRRRCEAEDLAALRAVVAEYEVGYREQLLAARTPFGTVHLTGGASRWQRWQSPRSASACAPLARRLLKSGHAAHVHKARQVGRL